MDQEKLVEKRGEEPAFLPGHVGESWQRVDFGLGASTIQSAPEVQDSLPPQDRHWGRMIAYALFGGLVTLILVTLVRKLIH
jgi:hypothetical protein